MFIWHAANGDLSFVAGCGQAHNEAAWAARFPGTVQFLLPAREDPAELAQREYPPQFALTGLSVVNTSASFQYTSSFGFAYTLERSPDLRAWSVVATSPPEVLPSASRTIADDAFPLGDRAFWRLQATPTP